MLAAAYRFAKVLIRIYSFDIPFDRGV